MALDSGGVRASVLLDLSQFNAQTEVLKQQTVILGDILQKLPDAKPKIDTKPMADDADKAKKLASEVADALGHLTGGRVELDIGQLEKAGADAQKIFSTLTEGFASSAAATAVFAAAVVAAVVEIEHVLVEMGEHWEAAFRKVAATTGYAGEQLHQFETSAVNVGKNSAASTENITAAMQQLSTRLQLTGADLEAATSQATKFAKVWGLDAGDAAKSLAQIMTLFHEPSTSAAKDLDILTAVAQKTQIPMEQLESQLKSRLGPTLVALGFNFAESALLLARMAEQGDAGRAAIQALNKILQEAAAAGKDPQVVFAELTEQLKQAGGVGTTTGDALATKLGPAFSILSVMAKRGGLDVKEAAADIAASGGQVNAAFDVMRSGADKIGAELTKLRNQFAPLGIEIAKVVNQLETDLAGAINQATRTVAGFLEMAGKVQAALPPQVTAAAAAAPALALGPAGIPVVAAAIAGAGAGGDHEADTHGADTHGGHADGGAEAMGAAADLAVPKVDALAKQIAALRKEIDAAGTNTVLITNLLTTIQTLEDVQKAVKALPPALGAEAEAALHAVEAETEANKERIKAADDLARAMAAKAGVARDTAAADAGNIETTKEGARAALEERGAIQALFVGRTANIGLVIAEKNARDALDQVEAAYATAEKSRAAAVEAGATAEEAAAEAAKAHTAAMPSLTDALSKYVDAAALFSVQQERANTILGAAKPYLDADQEATVKVAVAQGDLAKALTIAGQAMGLTDTQIQDQINALQGSQEEFDLYVNAVKAVKIPHDELLKSLGALATDAYPNLTRAQADALRQTVAIGDATDTAAALAKVYGVSIDEINQHLADSQAHFDEWAKQVAAAHRPLADYISDENKSRVSSLFGALSKGLDETTVGMAKQQEKSGDLAGAIHTLAAAHGVSAQQADAWVASIQAGGPAAAMALEQVKTLAEYVLSHGEMRLKVVVDIEQTQAAIGKLQQDYQDQMGKFADAETKATNTHVHALSQIDAAQTKSVEQYNLASQKYALDVEASQLKLDATTAKAIHTQYEAVSKIHDAQDAAIAKYTQTIGDAQAKLAQTFKDATEQYSKSMEGFAERARQIIQQAAETAAGALHQVSGAMQSFNDQQRQQANAASIAQQNSDLAKYGLTDWQSQQSDIRLKEIQAAGTAGLQQVGQANALNQTLQGANQALQKATEKAADEMGKLDKSIQNLNETYQKTLDKALRDEAKTVRDASQAEEKTLRDLDAQANKAVDQMTAVWEKALDENQAKQDELAKQKAILDQKQMEDRAKFDEERQREAEKFADDEKLRRDAEQAATKAFQDKMHSLTETLVNQLAVMPGATADAIAKKLHLGPETLDFKGSTFQETGVSFVGALVTEFSTHITGGGGG